MRITRIFPVQFAATEKHTETGKNARFAYGLSEMQGWRLSQSRNSTSFPLPCLRPPHTRFFEVLCVTSAIS